jgi:hypothetical protein
MLVFGLYPDERGLGYLTQEKCREHEDRPCHVQEYTETETLVLPVPQRWRPCVRPRWQADP